MVGAGQVVQLVAEDAIAARGREMQREPQCGQRQKNPEIAARGRSAHFPFFLAAGFGGVACGSGAVAGGDAAGGTSRRWISQVGAAPGLIAGGEPRSPCAMSEGQVSLYLPPTFISCSANVQQGITPFNGNSAGSPRSTELSNTVPSRSVP